MRTLSRRQAMLGLVATGLAACAPAPAVEPTAAPKPTAAGAAPAPAGKIPLVNTIPNAPPRATAVPAPAGATPPPKPVPPKPMTKDVLFYVDTVTAGAGESKYNVDADRYCAINSTFRRGMHIVWRMYTYDNTGKELQEADVDAALLKLPHGEEVKFRWGRHGATEDSPWFWTAAWDVPMDYPLGVLDFAIQVNTKAGKSGIFKQIPVSAPDRGIESRLQIVE